MHRFDFVGIKMQNPPEDFSYHEIGHVEYTGNNWHAHVTMQQLTGGLYDSGSNIFGAGRWDSLPSSTWENAKLLSCFKFLDHLA